MRARRLSGPPCDRFWPKVNLDGPVSEHRPDLGRCWLWTAATNQDGYGIFRVNGRNVRAHRWSYQEIHGPLPAELVPDHLCRVPGCVNPWHLEAVTQAENAARGLPGGRSWRSEITHCPAGHPYDETNTVVYYGSRCCRACRRARTNQARDRRRAQEMA